MKQLIPALFVVGAVMLLIGAAVYVTGWQLSPYIYGRCYICCFGANKFTFAI